MLKPIKKKNDNFSKKDFFSSKKKNRKTYILYGSKIKSFDCTLLDDKIGQLPNVGQFIFFTTKKNRSSSLFVEEIAKYGKIDECYMIVSKLKQDIAIDLNKKFGVKIGVSNSLSKSIIFDSRFMKHIKNNHAKMIIAKSGSNFYVIEGSGNPSINARREFYLLSNDEQNYNLIKSIYENA